MGEAFERSIRRFLPGNQHIVLAVLGTYVGGFALYKMTSGGSREEPAAAVVETPKVEETSAPAAGSSGQDIFLTGKWEKNSKNIEGFFNWLEKPGNADKWSKSF